MKKLITVLVSIWVLSSSAFAQNTLTPNLGLEKPPAIAGSWGQDINENFDRIDAEFANDAHPVRTTTCTGSDVITAVIDGVPTCSAVAADLGGSVSFTGDITPPQITSDANNYNPTGLSTAAVLRLDTDASRNVTGLVGGADGRLILIFNVGSNNVVLVNESGSSTDLNRFAINANIALAANQGIILQYDSISLRWRAASGISGGGGQAADNDLTALAALSCTGIVTRTGTETFTCRTITGSGGVTVTNGGGIAAAPDISLDTSIVKNNQSNAFTTGDQDFSNATTLTVPIAPGAAPTVSGRVAYDSTGETLEFGRAGINETFAALSDLQAISIANLQDLDTDFAPTIYTKYEATAGAPAAGSCERAGQIQFNTTNTRLYGCYSVGGNPVDLGAQSDNHNGVSDGTNSATASGSETILIARVASLATEVEVFGLVDPGETPGQPDGPFNTQPSNDAVQLISSSASDDGTKTITIYGTTNGADQSDVVIETIALNGTTPVTTVKINWGKIYAIKQATGASLVGTVTIREDSGDVTITQMGPGQTRAANQDTVFIKAAATIADHVKSIWIPASAMSVSGSCTDTEPAERTIVASGPKRYTIQPADDNTCSIEFDWVSPDSWNAGTITVELAAFSSGNNNTEVLELDFAGNAVSSGDQIPVHSTTGEQATTVTFGNQTNDYRQATSAAITLNGTPVAGDHIFVRGQIDATATTVTPMSDVHILGVKVEYTVIGSGSD